ncbi:MAG: metallophosphoesterase family protein [Phycisphaerales bacterium]
MAIAVISDIHGNAAALRATLADIESRGITRIICLGDIIGYGPEPLECIDLVEKHCEWSLLGNHDFGVLYEPTNFNQSAEAAAYWTRAQFDAVEDQGERARRYEFLGKLRVRVSQPLPEPPEGSETVAAPADAPGRSILAVHGSPRRPINEYVFPDDVINAQDKMRSIFDVVDWLVMCGHTHVPGVFTNEPDFYPPSEAGGDSTYRFNTDEKAIINVGSVGQPRDFDPRASYGVLHHDRIEFRRVEYDIEETARKIRAIPELTDWLAERLFEGR